MTGLRSCGVFVCIVCQVVTFLPHIPYTMPGYKSSGTEGTMLYVLGPSRPPQEELIEIFLAERHAEMYSFVSCGLGMQREGEKAFS